MTDTVAAPVGPGTWLRQARESQGVSLDDLSHVVKVPVGKLEALEAERYEELPGPAFVRALVLSVCRHLNVDAQEIMAQLPVTPPSDEALEQNHRGLATPYIDSNQGLGADWSGRLQQLAQPAVLVPLLVLVAAIAFFLLPTWRVRGADAGLAQASGAGSKASAEFVVSTEGLSSGTLVNPQASAPTLPTVAESASALAGGLQAMVGMASGVMSAPLAAAPASGVASSGQAIVLQTREACWVEVRDSKTVLASRLLPAGEVLNLAGVPPYKVKIGNAAAATLSYQGQAVDLRAATKDNVARLDLN